MAIEFKKLSGPLMVYHGKVKKIKTQFLEALGEHFEKEVKKAPKE